MLAKWGPVSKMLTATKYKSCYWFSRGGWKTRARREKIEQQQLSLRQSAKNKAKEQRMLSNALAQGMLVKHCERLLVTYLLFMTLPYSSHISRHVCFGWRPSAKKPFCYTVWPRPAASADNTSLSEIGTIFLEKVEVRARWESEGLKFTKASGPVEKSEFQ